MLGIVCRRGRQDFRAAVGLQKRQQWGSPGRKCVSSRCVFTIKQRVRGKAASVSLERRAGMRKRSMSRERGDQGQKRTGWLEV